MAELEKLIPATKEEAQKLLASIDPSFRIEKVESTEKTATQIEAHNLLKRIAPWAQ